METGSLLTGDLEYSYLTVIALRTLIMFVMILVFLRLLGKRGIKQLSVFELVVILGLGSAAGDPMLYKEIGIATALVTFLIVVLCYKMLTFLVFKYKWVEHLVEGKEVCIVKKGAFAIKQFSKETLSKDEFFMELRVHGVYHLGQVEYALLEVSGDVSVYFYEKDKTRYGLPILPDVLKKTVHIFKPNIYYSCTFCGNTIKCIAEKTSQTCTKCQRTEWVKASNRKIVM